MFTQKTVKQVTVTHQIFQRIVLLAGCHEGHQTTISSVFNYLAIYVYSVFECIGVCGAVQTTALPYKPKIKSTSRGGLSSPQLPITGSVNCNAVRQPSPTLSCSSPQPQRGMSPHHGATKKRMSSGDANGLLARWVMCTWSAVSLIIDRHLLGLLGCMLMRQWHTVVLWWFWRSTLKSDLFSESNTESSGWLCITKRLIFGSVSRSQTTGGG